MAEWLTGGIRSGVRWGLLGGGLLVVVVGILSDEHGAVVVGGIALLLGLGMLWRGR